MLVNDRNLRRIRDLEECRSNKPGITLCCLWELKSMCYLTCTKHRPGLEPVHTVTILTHAHPRATPTRRHIQKRGKKLFFIHDSRHWLLNLVLLQRKHMVISFIDHVRLRPTYHLNTKSIL